MSVFEMRIDQLGFDTEGVYHNIQSFSIGHESCILKFFMIIRNMKLLEFIKRQKDAEKQIRIMTPFVPEKHLEEMKDVIKKICANEEFKDSIIIVNDFGLMNYIHKIDKGRKMCLGRGMLVCFDYAPWGSKIYENEPVQIQKAVSQVSFYDDEKMSFFRQYNVTEIEANITEGTAESLKEIQKAGFKVNVHQSTFLYGTQRSCHIRRSCPAQTCSGLECEEPQKLELNELWCSEGFYKAAEDVPFPSPLYLHGNQIYGKAYDIPCDWADRIIYSRQKHLPT